MSNSYDVHSFGLNVFFHTLPGYCSFFIYGTCIVKDPTFPVCGSWEGQPSISMKNRHKTPHKPQPNQGGLGMVVSFDLNEPKNLIAKPVFKKYASDANKGRK